MRLRFTIRDLLWLTLVVALATGWWLDHKQLTTWDGKGGPGIIDPFPIMHDVFPDATEDKPSDSDSSAPQSQPDTK
jgi:hypothetical protein